MNTDPGLAPPRTDLPYLRRRHRPVVQPAPALAAVSAAPSVAVPAPPVSTSLDLDEAAVPPPVAESPAPAAPPRRLRADPRVRAGERIILTATAPTVTLGRLQSAIGTLRIEAACSAEVGDLRLGCAYQLASGYSSVVAPGGARFGPPGGQRPVLVAAHDQFDTISVDLRQSPELRRLAVYAYSESRAPLRWGGTLVVETLGRARVEVPLESLQGPVAMLLTLYNIRGEFVLRAELESIAGGVREACRAYGYDRITWLDDRTPVD